MKALILDIVKLLVLVYLAVCILNLFTRTTQSVADWNIFRYVFELLLIGK